MLMLLAFALRTLLRIILCVTWICMKCRQAKCWEWYTHMHVMLWHPPYLACMREKVHAHSRTLKATIIYTQLEYNIIIIIIMYTCPLQRHTTHVRTTVQGQRCCFGTAVDSLVSAYARNSENATKVVKAENNRPTPSVNNVIALLQELGMCWTHTTKHIVDWRINFVN